MARHITFQCQGIKDGEPYEYFATYDRNTEQDAIDEIEAAGTRTYIGNAAIGSAESASVWQIKVLDTPGLTKLWADGNDNFDNVWDDRATVTYS